MKVLVTHDDHGTIRSVGVSASTPHGKAMLRPPSGHHVTEVEAPDVTDEQDHNHLREIISHFRIELSHGQPKLVRK
jgi:hypothetical protein